MNLDPRPAFGKRNRIDFDHRWECCTCFFCVPSTAVLGAGWTITESQQVLCSSIASYLPSPSLGVISVRCKSLKGNLLPTEDDSCGGEWNHYFYDHVFPPLKCYSIEKKCFVAHFLSGNNWSMRHICNMPGFRSSDVVQLKELICFRRVLEAF